MEIENLRIDSDEEHYEQDFDLSYKFSLTPKTAQTGPIQKIVIILPGNATLFIQSIVAAQQLKQSSSISFKDEKRNILANLYELDGNLIVIMNYKQDNCIYKEIVRLLTRTYNCRWTVLVSNIHNVLLQETRIYQQSTKDGKIEGVRDILEDYNEELVDDEMIQFMQKQGIKGSMLIQHCIKQDGDYDEVVCLGQIFGQCLGINWSIDRSSVMKMIEEREKSRNYSQLYM